MWKYIPNNYIEYKEYYIEDLKNGSYSVSDKSNNFVNYFEFAELEEIKKWIDKQ